LVEFDNIPIVKPSDFAETNEYKNKLHICLLPIKQNKLTKAKWKNYIIKPAVDQARSPGLKFDALPYDEVQMNALKNVI
jgi:hypothetical protein